MSNVEKRILEALDIVKGQIRLAQNRFSQPIAETEDEAWEIIREWCEVLDAKRGDCAGELQERFGWNAYERRWMGRARLPKAKELIKDLLALNFDFCNADATLQYISDTMEAHVVQRQSMTPEQRALSFRHMQAILQKTINQRIIDTMAAETFNLFSVVGDREGAFDLLAALAADGFKISAERRESLFSEFGEAGDGQGDAKHRLFRGMSGELPISFGPNGIPVLVGEDALSAEKLLQKKADAFLAHETRRRAETGRLEPTDLEDMVPVGESPSRRGIDLTSEAALSAASVDEITALAQKVGLSRQQKQIFEALVQSPEASNAKIAAILGVAENTVSVQKQRMRKKINLYLTV